MYAYIVISPLYKATYYKWKRCCIPGTWDKVKRRKGTQSAEQRQRWEALFQSSNSTLGKHQPKLICQKISTFQSMCPNAMHTLPRSTDKHNGGEKQRRKPRSFKKLTWGQLLTGMHCFLRHTVLPFTQAQMVQFTEDHISPSCKREHDLLSVGVATGRYFSNVSLHKKG